MSFEDEIQRATNAIDELARAQLRQRFPYMKIKALEGMLAETANVFISRLVEQKKEICAAQSRTSFMSLSAELRNMIYEMALKVERPVNMSHQANVCYHTTLLLANRQIYEEARPIWYNLNTFRFIVGDPMFWPHLHESEPDFDGPRSVSKWLQTLGSSAAMVESITMEVWGSSTPGSLLLGILRSSGQCLRFDGSTVHQAALKASDLLDLDVSPEVFTFLFSAVSEAAKDLYTAAGVSGEDILTRELIKRLK